VRLAKKGSAARAPAADLPDATPPQAKTERLARLQVPRRRKDTPTLARRQPWRERAARREKAAAADEFISQQVDPILDKIAAHGLHSLTDAERKILETARKKIDKR